MTTICAPQLTRIQHYTKKIQNLKLNDNLFTPCDLINSELFFNDLNESILNQNKDEIDIYSQHTKDSSDNLTIQPTTAANLIEIETVKNKLSSLWNNVKYGWASYIKKPTKISLEKSGPIYILGKKFNPNNPYESPVSMNHLNSNETQPYDIIDASLNESFINPSIPIFNDLNKLKPSINNDYLSSSSSASLSTSPMNYLNNKFINHQSYYLVDTTKKKTSYLQQQTDSETKSHLEKELHSRLWFTYRKDFKPLNGNLKYTSDCGWGCMLRSAQMLLAQAFLLHFFGKEWSLYRKFKTDEYNLYKEIISWFNDRPSRHCPFGIHRLLEIADKKLIGNSNDSSQLGSRVGSWFGPTSVCLLMKEALNESIDYKPMLDQIKLYVAQDCTIYKQDVIDLCLDSRTNSFKPCIILVSVRLGGEDLNDMYVSSLKKFLESDTCIGIIGGKPKHSLYFIGYQGDKVIYLDPHFCQPTTNIYSNNDPTHIANNISPVSSLSSSKHSYDDSSDYEVFENSSYHCENPSITPFNKLDPSLAIGFYCATLNDLNNLCEFVKKAPSFDNIFPIFGVSEDSFEKVQSNYQFLSVDEQHSPKSIVEEPSSNKKQRSRKVSLSDNKSPSTSTGHKSRTASSKSKVAGSFFNERLTSQLIKQPVRSKTTTSGSKVKRRQSCNDPDDFVLV